MRHALWICALSALTLALGMPACSDDSVEPGIGSVSGKVTFLGTWPAAGDVQVSIYSSLDPPDYAPGGAPDGFTTPITPGTMEFNYTLDGLDTGNYTGILVSWREPANPGGARMLGLYWLYPDSVAVEPSGLAAKSPGPTRVRITTSDPRHTGLDITADLDIVP